MGTYYKMRRAAVEIHQQPMQAPIVLDEENLLAAIESIKQRQDDYATQKAWHEHLREYEGALEFLRVAKKESAA